MLTLTSVTWKGEGKKEAILQWSGRCQPPCVEVISWADGAKLKLVSELLFISILIFDGRRGP